MAVYKAPVRDIQFVLHEVLGVEQEFAKMPGFEEANAELIDSVLEEGAKFCENVFFPTNSVGDEGCKFANGEVTTPPGFKEAYDALRESGWMTLAFSPEFGGQGLPGTLAVFFEEMLQSSNMALSLYPGLTRGACVALQINGSKELKDTFLPKLVNGEWTGVMCLTEPHCGTDLGLLRTKAEPNGDGAYSLSGTKIFITGGEQDLTDNIVHLVLARLPDAPPGVKGISMLLVPKFLVNADGSLGERNGVSCGSIEHKMGIKGASTCVMNYENAVGYMVGEPHRGLQAMFSMMNHERILVGQQGLSLGEVAYQSAVEYARERVQGRAPGGAKQPDKAADPIIVHPDIRRMLMTSKAYNEGARALLGWLSLEVDKSHHHADAETRESASDLVALLIPVVKAFVTDCGSEVTNSCLQVFGGHGYIAEWGMEQLVRDARIAQIYEGANGIHALDLVARKLPMHDGRLIKRFIALVEEFLEQSKSETALDEFNAPLGDALQRLSEATEWIANSSQDDANEAGAASYDYLRLLALVSYGYMWSRQAQVALAQRDGDNSGFYDTKLATARFFVKRLLPQTESLKATLTSGADAIMALEAEAF